MKAVILAAAPSDRLRPFTETRAKPMIRVAGTTILEYMMRSLKDAGIRDILIVVNHMRDTIRDVFGHGHTLGISVDYVEQEPLDGIGGALDRCRPQLGEAPFLLIYGDILATGFPFHRLSEEFEVHGGGVAAVSLPRSSAEFGNVYLGQDMRIEGFVEKPTDRHLANHVLAGIFLLPPTVFELLSEKRNDMEAVYQALIERNQFHGALWDGGWIDITRPWHILEANKMLLDHWDDSRIHRTVKLEGNVHLEGPLYIEEGVSIGTGSVLKGPCFIGRGSYIGNNTLIRGYTSLGPESVVGYGTELKNCVLFGKSILGRLSYIGDSVIGERVHLGTGVATVNLKPDRSDIAVAGDEGEVSTGMNKLGAFIGDDVTIGARHVLGPGTRIRSGFQQDDRITLDPVL
ncbi:MAG: sugar phosphate nucleotidyltransferase [SAR324 cluster bacterium]|nr:sugar phosphate nucleotidyltransferase [SAR324 cluster bacterium]